MRANGMMRLGVRTVLTIACAALVAGIAGGGVCADTFADALALFNSGDWARAASHLVQAASERQGDVVVRITAAVALANVKRYTEAVDQLHAAIRLHPDGILPYLLLDALYTEMGEEAKSVWAREQVARITSSGRAFNSETSSDRVLLKSLASYPQNAIAHLLLGDLYQLRNDLDLAKKQYERARSLAPGWVKPLFNLGLAELRHNPRQAEQRFREVIKADPSNRRAYLWLGDALAAQNRLQEALEAYETASTDRALYAEAQIRIGNVHLRAGRMKQAEESFARAEGRAPTDPRVIAGKAQVLQNQGKLAEAESHYTRAIDVLAQNKAPVPAQVVVQNQLALVQLEQGKLKDAVNNLSASYQLQPTLANAEALVSAQQRAGVLADAVKEAEARLSLAGRDVRTMIYLLAAYKATEQFEKCVELASRLVSADPGNTVSYLIEAGEAQARIGDIPGALDAYMRAIRAGRDADLTAIAQSAKRAGVLGQLADRVEKLLDSSPTQKNALVLFELRSVQAVPALLVTAAEKLVRINPDSATNWLRLGQAYEQAGNLDLALAAYGRVVAGSDAEAVAVARERIEKIRKLRDTSRP